MAFPATEPLPLPHLRLPAKTLSDNWSVLPDYYEQWVPKPGQAGFAVLYLNVRGHGNEPRRCAPNAPFIAWDIADWDRYFYRGVYLDWTRLIAQPPVQSAPVKPSRCILDR